MMFRAQRPYRLLAGRPTCSLFQPGCRSHIAVCPGRQSGDVRSKWINHPVREDRRGSQDSSRQSRPARHGPALDRRCRSPASGPRGGWVPQVAEVFGRPFLHRSLNATGMDSGDCVMRWYRASFPSASDCTDSRAASHASRRSSTFRVILDDTRFEQAIVRRDGYWRTIGRGGGPKAVPGDGEEELLVLTTAFMGIAHR